MLRILVLIAVILVASFGEASADPTCQLKSSGTAGSNQMFMPFPAALKHGINLTRWWEDSQDSPVSPDDLKRLHDMGLDFIRLPISPVWLEIADDDEQTQKLDKLHCDIVSILNEGFTIILDLRPTKAYKNALFHHPEEIIPHIELLWNKLQPVIADLPSWRVYLEIFDEPLLDSDSWWRLQEKIVDDMRPVFPGNTFIASPGPFNGWWEISGKIPYKDTNVIYDIHFFEPLIFARNGDPDLLPPSDQTKTPTPQPGQTPPSGSPGNQAPQQPAAAAEQKAPPQLVYPVDKDFNFNMADPDVEKYVSENWDHTELSVLLRDASAWRDHYNAITVCLEFGVYRQYVDDKSRYNWIRDVHQTLDDMNMPWALWEYRGPYGLLDSQGTLDGGMMQALNLKKASLR